MTDCSALGLQDRLDDLLNGFDFWRDQKIASCELTGSMCELGGGDGCPMSVRAEHDESHYGDRSYGAGPMHPTTERVLKAVYKATKDERIA